jgi:outer membrane protein OmpA-like peptidoglycan-associated protein
MAAAQMAALAPTPAPIAAPAPAPMPAPSPVVTAPPVVQQPIAAQPLMATPIEDRVAAAQPGRGAYGGAAPGASARNVQVAVIQFGPGASGLSGNDFAVLQRVAELQRFNRATIRIVAHAAQDGDGSAANYEVSRRRALAVAIQLVRLGVPADRIIAEAASDAMPIYETRTARGLAANRRVEIFIDL